MGILVLFLILRGKAFSFSLMSMLVVSFPYMAFSMLWYVPSMQNLLRAFLKKEQ